MVIRITKDVPDHVMAYLTQDGCAKERDIRERARYFYLGSLIAVDEKLAQKYRRQKK